MLKTDKQKRFKTSLLALAIAAMPLGVHAAGLGKLTVISALGQPLRAEIDLTASREETASLSAKLASAEAFRNAGIEYSPSLSDVRFVLDKRPNGQPYLQVSSNRPLNEPFVDMLVEVNWASGRLVREYTFLLDPPDVFKKSAAPEPVAVPEVKKEAAAPAQAPAPAAESRTIEPRAVEAPAEGKPAKKAAAKTAEKAAEKAAEGGATRTVKKGDTLSKIANETKPEGVSLDQMLVALFRGNKDAFDAANMNRLRAGKILSIPDKDAVAAVEQGEARKVVVAQAIDFNAYRKKLAAVAAAEPVKEEAPKQAAAGKIAPKVEEKVPAAPAGKDKLEVSRTETGKAAAAGKPGAKDRVAEEDIVARDKALKEANTRIAELEKNLGDLKKLAEMKSAAGAKLQDQAQAAKPGAVPAAEAKKPEPAPAPAAKPAAELAKPAAAPAPAAPEKPAEAAKPADQAAKPAENAPPAPKPPAKKPLPPPPPPPPPPSFTEENPGLVFGGGGIIAILLGYLGYNAWRKKKQKPLDEPQSVAAADLSTSSVFATTGGQSIDTGAASLSTDFSKSTAAGGIADEGVDPVAEADVYMAYGRDSQAEEILLEALKTDPTRLAIHLKLLEIYAARKSLGQFESLARDVHGLTSGTGPDWEKTAALGRSLDPTNVLYGGAPTTVGAGADISSAATVIGPAAELQSSAMETMVMPGALSQMAAEAAAAPAPAPAPAVEEELPASLDFDLDLGAAAPAAVAAPAAPAASPPAAEEVMSLDFDLGTSAPTAPAEAAPAPVESGLDFDLGTAPAAAAPAVELPVGGGNEIAPLDFDFNLGDTAAPAAAGAAVSAAEPEAPALDLSAISLDLGEPSAPAAAAPAAPAGGEAPAADNPEVATKLELAQAYEEMGDKEGARELLNEVLKEGSPAQQETARSKLAQLG